MNDLNSLMSVTTQSSIQSMDPNPRSAMVGLALGSDWLWSQPLA